MRLNRSIDVTHSDFFVQGLDVTYCRGTERIPAVQDAGLGFDRGRVTVIIGESGSGKTTVARALTGMLSPEQALVSYRSARLPARTALVQQEPHAGLHPLIPIGEQIADCAAARAHGSASARGNRHEHDNTRARRTPDARGIHDTRGNGQTRRTDSSPVHTALKLLEELGLTPPGLFYPRYAHALSGGQAQRAVLARALAMESELLVADEPTSQLDLVAQAEAVRLIGSLAARGLAVCYITHDLPLASEIGSTAAVLFQGRIVEQGPLERVWDRPVHEYTQKLLGEMTK